MSDILEQKDHVHATVCTMIWFEYVVGEGDMDSFVK